MFATEEEEMCDDYQIRLEGVRVDGGLSFFPGKMK